MGTITYPPYDVYSKTNSNESFYKDASGQWLDFFNYDAYNNFQTEWNDNSWNFAITGYTVVSGNACDGDFDGDGDVDGLDLANFASNFGDTSDLATFAAHLGSTTCPANE